MPRWPARSTPATTASSPPGSSAATSSIRTTNPSSTSAPTASTTETETTPRLHPGRKAISLDLDELDLEDERRIGGDVRRVALRPVAHSGGDRQLADLAHLHAGHPFDPARDHD